MEVQNIQYEQCEFCNRKFFEGKLKMHLKLCSKEKPMIFIAKGKEEVKKKRSKSMVKPKSLGPKKTNRENSSLDRSYITTAECHICGRKFNPRNLESHIELCQKNQKELMYKKMLIEKQLKQKKISTYHCKQCSYEMEQDHNFCGRCGFKRK
ncbi:unnamed protein product [Paramecium primaurelia]|uniref:C2HC/C3H-type domain-containing protein n=1 Tax=Paramecium primaurelia TaxID=5886 RepID=A0A8S1P6G0_PARPR|nr:unnamed protein product [Paramecium primaurelia]